MQVKEVLNDLQIGNSVAEFDQDLERYFVETETFRALIQDRVDVVAGDKGTGKTALFRVLQNRYRAIPELDNIEVISAFNPSGNPVFQRLAQEQTLTEGEYSLIWKAYFLSLVGNWLLGIYENSFTPEMQELDNLLKGLDLRSADDSAATVFSKILRVFRRLINPTAAQAEISFQESGIPIIKPRLEFGDPDQPGKPEKVSQEAALKLLNTCLNQIDVTCWVVLDRLDEAFQGFPKAEVPALRALFRSYLDLLEFERIRIKLFVRKDLFRKIVQGGFVNLTHINARKIEIVWDDDDLQNLLARRIRQNQKFVDHLNLADTGNERLFNRIFPIQVDVGDRKPATWSWIMSRIRDGNGLKPPRNLIDLFSMAREAQLRREDREAREMSVDFPIIEPDSIKRALSRLSEQRVQDTLLAEAGSAAPLIELFREGKAEQNDLSLGKLLNIDPKVVKSAIRPLIEIGFLEELSDSYKIPSLYRDGLAVTQGKAY
jgi:hypothetical protein